jgi:hypothetical protein
MMTHKRSFSVPIFFLFLFLTPIWRLNLSSLLRAIAQRIHRFKLNAKKILTKSHFLNPCHSRLIYELKYANPTPLKRVLISKAFVVIVEE